MRGNSFFLSVRLWAGTALLVSAALAAEEAAPSDAEFAAWVKRLGAGDFDAREDAREKLKAAGERARPALEAAAKSDDTEIASSAQALLAILAKPVIRVRLVDTQDRPVADGRVALNWHREGRLSPAQWDLQLGHRLYNVTSDKDGVAVFRDLPPGKCSLSISAMGELRGQLYKPEVEIKAGSQEYRLKCIGPGFIKGVLLAQDKTPLAGVLIYAVPGPVWTSFKGYKNLTVKLVAGTLMAMPSARSAQDGSFRIAAHRPGPYILLATKDDQFVLESKPVELEAEKEADAGQLHTNVPAGSTRKAQEK